MYRLDNRYLHGPFTVAVVGCGGTGGFVAEGLCRLLPPLARLVLVDPDRVEARNLGRQNFGREDLGQFKSQTLAQRLARRHGRPVAYSVLPVTSGIGPGDVELLVGCVDNGLARRDIASKVHFRSCWWVDAGNGEEFGQVLVGNARKEHLIGAFDQEQGLCYALPLPTIQRPELLARAPRAPSCAQAVVAGEQGPTINQWMAALAVEAVRRLLEGRLTWFQAYLDLEAGSLRTVPITPEGVSGMTGIPVKKLLRIPDGK